MSRDPKDLVREYVEVVLNGHDLAALDRYVDSERLHKAAVGIVSANPDLRITVEHLIAEGDLVAGRFMGEGTHTGTPWRKIPASGKPWHASCNLFFQIEGDRIVESWINWDWLSITQQLGVVPPLP